MIPNVVMTAALAVVVMLVPPAVADGISTTRSCASVGFTPNSDDLATNIRAQGVTCRFARKYVRDSEGQPGERFRGFTCAKVAVDAPEGLPYRRYRCQRGDDVIRWRRY